MPKLLKTPFAIDAAEGFRTDIQESTGAAPNSATYQVGFPPVTMQSIASNGMPPKGSDLNGVLYDITDNLVFLTQGGGYGFDAAYATSIGGYPLNARLRLTNGDIVKSTVDGNTNDPNVDMTGWVLDNKALVKLNSQFVSVWDYFTKEEVESYKASPTTFDAYRPIQAFFDNIAVNNYGVAYCSGKFRTSQGLNLTVTGDSLNSTRTVIGELDVTCLNPIETTIKFSLGQDFNWFGKVIARGQGSVSTNSRTCQNGIEITASSRSFFHKLVARQFIGHGVFLPDGDTLVKIGEVRTSDVGSGHYDTGSQLTNFTAGAKTGSAGSVAQRQTIVVDVVPKFKGDDYYNVLIDGQPYFVSATNRITKELTIFPWLPATNTTTSLKYLYGGGLSIYGGDSSEVIIDSIDCVRTGTAYINGALYSANVTVLQTQSCGVAMQFGSSPASATIGGVIQNMYCEANQIDILRCTRAAANFFISSDVSLDLSKTRYTSAARDGGDSLITYNNLNGFSIFKNGVLQSRSTIGNLELTNSQEPVLYGNNFTSNLTLDETILQSYPDLLVKKLLYIGAGANQQPTTGITINPPSGYTLNGLTSLSFTNLSRPLEVTLGLRLGTKSIIVTSNHIPMASVTYDPPSIPSDGSVSTTVTLPGVALGQTVSAAFSRYNADIEITPIVSATDTVTIKFKNTGAGAVDLASGTLTVKLI